MKSSGYTVGTGVKGHWKAIVIGADGFGDFPSFLPDPHALPNTQMPIQGRPPWMEGGTKGPLCPERSSVVRHWTHCLPFSMEASSCFCNNVGMFPFMFFWGVCFNTAVWTNTHCITNPTSFLHFNLLSSLYTKQRKWSVGMALYVLRSPPYFTAESLRLLKPVLRGGWIDSLRTQK